jgi:NADH-quinone oxidoreductase subunit L
MVTAGVYMIARSSIIYVLAPVAMEVITIVGMLTAIWAACIALTQTDIKKVLAYSTVSQLGYMFVALGVGSFTGAVFHLMTHAFFKALLFLGAGSVIHAMSGEQDMRSMGGLRKKLPITFITILIGTLAISGLPPFAGFFSKDEILTATLSHSLPVFIVMAITSMLTAFYMFRMLFLTFYGTFRGTHEQEHHLHESPKSMTIPLIVLAFFSTFSGFLGLPEVFSEHHSLNEFLKGSFIMTNVKFSLEHASHSMEYFVMGLSLALVIISYFIAKRRYTTNAYLLPTDQEKMTFIERISFNKFYIDEFYAMIVTKPLNNLSSYYKKLDAEVIDGFVNGLGKVTMNLSRNLKTIQTGYTGFYIFAMVVGIVIIMMLNFILS